MTPVSALSTIGVTPLSSLGMTGLTSQSAEETIKLLGAGGKKAKDLTPEQRVQWKKAMREIWEKKNIARYGSRSVSLAERSLKDSLSKVARMLPQKKRLCGLCTDKINSFNSPNNLNAVSISDARHQCLFCTNVCS